MSANGVGSENASGIGSESDRKSVMVMRLLEGLSRMLSYARLFVAADGRGRSRLPC